MNDSELLAMIGVRGPAADAIRDECQELECTVAAYVGRAVVDYMILQAADDYGLTIRMTPEERGAFDGMCSCEGVDPAHAARCAVLETLHSSEDVWDGRRAVIAEEQETGVNRIWEDFAEDYHGCE